MPIRFGPAGNSDSFYNEGFKHTTQMPAWLAARGLNAFEYSFGHGVKMRPETARDIGDSARENGIALSLHAPYYINLATQEPDKQEKTIGYILDTAQVASWMGASRVIFHPGSAGTDRAAALDAAKALLERTLAAFHEQGYHDMLLCPETMGKDNQLGRVEEVVALCALDDCLYPTIDFGHLNAVSQGALHTRDDFARVLDTLEPLGDKGQRFHVHFSHIEYTKAGEKRHLTFADTQFGPDFALLAPLLAERKLEPTVICESDGTMAEDAAEMKRLYKEALATI